MNGHYLKQVWSAFKSSTDDPDQVSHEIDILAGHENVVNYVQFRFVSRQFKLFKASLLFLKRYTCVKRVLSSMRVIKYLFPPLDIKLTNIRMN